jgi:hypothetical protein
LTRRQRPTPNLSATSAATRLRAGNTGISSGSWDVRPRT